MTIGTWACYTWYLIQASVASAHTGVHRRRMPMGPVLLNTDPKGNVNSSVILDGVPETKPAIIDHITAYEGIKGAYFQGFSADDGMFISARPDGKDTLQIYSVGTPLGPRQQMTDEKDAVGSCASAPLTAPSQGVLFAMSKDGSELDQLYFLPFMKGASPQLLTNGRSKHQYATWSDDGLCIAFSGNQRDQVHFDVYVADAPENVVKGVHCLFANSNAGELNGLPSKRVFETTAEGGSYVLDFAAGALLIGEYRSATSAPLTLIKDLSAPTMTTPISPQSCRARGGVLWIQNGSLRGVLYGSDQDSNFRTLRYFDVESGQTRILESTANVHWDFEPVAYIASAGFAVAEANVDGVDQVWLISGGGTGGPTKAEQLRLDSLPPGQINGMKLKDSGGVVELGFTLISSEAPPQVYTVHLSSGANLRSANANQQLIQWTQPLGLGSFASIEFVSPTIAHFQSFDDRTIPAFVYRPPSIQNERAPVVIFIHGGPEAQFRTSFNSLIQFLLLERSIWVVAPNVRGSTGYGKDYVSLDDVEKREDSVKDIGALLNWIGLQEGMDASQVGVMGGSYGGYMSLASLAHYSDRLRCGVSTVGITDFVTFLERTSDYRRAQRRLEYGDETNPKTRQFLREISPRHQAANIKRPVLLGAGANDPRVPASEMILMKDALTQHGQETWLVVFKDEGHGWKKKKNRIIWKSTIVSFVDEYLLSPEWLKRTQKAASVINLPSMLLISLNLCFFIT